MNDSLEYVLYAFFFAFPLSTATGEALLYLAISLFFIKKIAYPDFSFTRKPIFFILFLFLSLSVISLVLSHSFFGLGLKSFTFKWFKYIVLFTVIYETFVDSPARLKKAFHIFILIGFIIACDGLFQKVTSVDFLRQQVMLRQRLQAWFHNENSLAAYVACILFFPIAYLAHPKIKVFFRLFLFLNILLSLYCLLFTFSRAAWLAFIFSSALFCFLIKKRIIFLTFCLGIAAMFFFPEFCSEILYSLQSGGNAFRFTIWDSALLMIRDRPFFGSGIGTFMSLFPKYAKIPGTYYAHNYLLQIWAESGVFCLALFMGFLFTLLKNGVSRFKEENNVIVLGFLCAVFTYLVHGLFEVHFYSLPLAMLFWSLAGLLNAAST